jgi:ribose transport system substrate-binding protein
MTSLASKALAGCLCASLALAACAKKSSEASGPRTDKDLRIAVIPKGTTHEFWKSIHAGAARAANELGVKITWKGPQKEDDRAQ